MPELPDLLYIRNYLQHNISGRIITGVALKQPVVLRMAMEGEFPAAIRKRSIDACDLRGPFIRLELSGNADVVIHLMLAGRIQHLRPGEKPEAFLCLSLLLDDGSKLNLCDDQKMAKVYLVQRGHYEAIPTYREQGVDILGEDFTLQRFCELASAHRGKQVRVFLNDQTILSAIGNAYADEILFEAGIHPKTFIRSLSAEEVEHLYHSISRVITWAAVEVEKAAQPIHVKVRTHLRVRNHRGQPCPRCGTTIRREGVRGFDTFFCPNCQPASRKLFLDWNKPRH